MPKLVLQRQQQEERTALEAAAAISTARAAAPPMASPVTATACVIGAIKTSARGMSTTPPPTAAAVLALVKILSPLVVAPANASARLPTLPTRGATLTKSETINGSKIILLPELRIRPMLPLSLRPTPIGCEAAGKERRYPARAFGDLSPSAWTMDPKELCSAKRFRLSSSKESCNSCFNSLTSSLGTTVFCNRLATTAQVKEIRTNRDAYMASIEKVLEMGQRASWINELVSKENAPIWLLSVFAGIRRREARAEAEAFCARYGFGSDVRHQLNQLSTERARRLMKGWTPMGPSQQRQWKEEFRARVAASLHDFTWQKERRKHDSDAIGNHARILQEWSDDEEEWLPPAAVLERINVEAGSFEAFDADTERSETAAPSRPLRASSSGGQKSSEGTSQTKVKRRVPDSLHPLRGLERLDGTEDCTSQDGDCITRLEAVLETCSHFNEEPVLHYSCFRAFDAQNELESLRPTAKNQTMFSMGIRGIHAAIRQDSAKLPARVVFLSDGEPTDPGSYLRDVQILMKKYPGDALKIYAVGFGESAKVNSAEGDFTYLQQLASLGHGHFQRCGSSLSSLQGAFTAVTSTISRTRSASSAGNSRQRAESAEPSSERPTGQLVGSNPWDLPSRTSASANQPQTHIIATIEEAAEGSESDDGEGSVRSHDRDDDVARQSASAAPNVEFELPNPDQIFDTSDSTKWKDFQAALTSFEFDGQKFTRKAEVKRVCLRQKPFMKGGMRLVYGMFHEENKSKLRQDVQARMCAKRLFQDLDKEQGFSAHAAFCKSTGVAQYYSKLFKQELRRWNIRHKLVFLPCHVYSPIGQEGGYHFCGEELLRGHFVKLNSNAGFVNEADYSEHSAIAQAFSHFTFDKSRGELMVVDLQGVCAESEIPYSLLTDPQVHSLGAFEKFGPGDLGADGMRRFFRCHTCGELCRKLGLRKEVAIAPPTKILPMPGYIELIKHMLGNDSKEFFMDLRRVCRISSITVPREAHSDWIDIRLWGDKGMLFNKAKRMLDARMEVFFTEARAVVDVDQAMPQWDVDGWQNKIEVWKTYTHAHIVPFPADWKVQKRVRQLWIFAEEEHGWYTHDKRDSAVKHIKEALAARLLCEPDNADKQNNEKQATAADTKRWERFRDPSNGKNYWYNSRDGRWFFESDRTWVKYKDDAANKHWWYNNDTADW
eukprot:CAMPEP_0169304176 /NCGR_PEP_ID=MMETSP1016-20121227/69747_1 /TAXON_ID=342587 /ORGANISM="Karlodinium micrum, Strain CCMP2283" /LENGTH=1173 /DNA_ID=CAMNT_0009397043 /DNA_START=1616 /DNA_END=5136 /DNA_ORIENTATION=+